MSLVHTTDKTTPQKGNQMIRVQKQLPAGCIAAFIGIRLSVDSGALMVACTDAPGVAEHHFSVLTPK